MTTSNLLWSFNVLQNPEDYPEYPKISRKYYVEFLFINDDVNEPSLVDDGSKVKVQVNGIRVFFLCFSYCYFQGCRVLVFVGL